MSRKALRHVIVGALVAILLAPAAPAFSGPASPTDRAVAAMKKGDFKSALAELKPLAAKGDPNAQFLLGMLYDAGNGVTQDQAVAASWYRKSAEQKHLIAQLFLGMLLYSGQGVKQDFKEAARWMADNIPGSQGIVEVPMPKLKVEGVGVISFPVPETKVRQITPQAQRTQLLRQRT